MERKIHLLILLVISVFGVVFTVNSLKELSVFYARSAEPFPPGTVVVPVTPVKEKNKDSLQLQTFPFITLTPTPTTEPPRPPASQSAEIKQVPGAAVPVTKPIRGGPVSPNASVYCMDDADPDGCDDNSSYHVPKGTGGIKGPCGTVIEQTHKLVRSLPQAIKATRNKLNPAVSNCGYNSGVSTSYVGTMLVIDAYNLAGFKELSKSNSTHVSPTGLLNWWKGNPAGYEFIPNSPGLIQQFASGQKDLTGCVMFMSLPSSVHIGIVNKLELFSPGGNGVISILQSGTRYFIDRFPVAGWSIKNVSTNQTKTGGVLGFGCHK